MTLRRPGGTSLGPGQRNPLLPVRQHGTASERARTHLTVAGRTLHDLEAQLSERLHAANLKVPRAELATMIRALTGDTVPPLRPLW
ncbi:hypothetical protein SUDANB70_03058 [Streptomyces sp. enrichment culture]